MVGPQEMLSHPEGTTKAEFQVSGLPADFITNKVCWPRNLQLFFNKGNLSYCEILCGSPRHSSAVKLTILPWLLVILTTHVLLEDREHVCVFHRCVTDTRKSISQIVDVINIYSVWKRKRLDHVVPLRHQTLTDHLLCDRACSQCSGKMMNKPIMTSSLFAQSLIEKKHDRCRFITEVYASKQRNMGLWIYNKELI